MGSNIGIVGCEESAFAVDGEISWKKVLDKRRGIDRSVNLGQTVEERIDLIEDPDKSAGGVPGAPGELYGIPQIIE
jgi:hypothetical protein